MEELIQRFLDGETLRRMFAYLCQSTLQDPITETVRVMLTRPVQFHLSRFGLGIFQDTPVLPFHLLTGEQRTWLHGLMQAIRSPGSAMHSALQRLDRPLQYRLANDRIFLYGKLQTTEEDEGEGEEEEEREGEEEEEEEEEEGERRKRVRGAVTKSQKSEGHALAWPLRQRDRLQPKVVLDALLRGVAESRYATPDRLKLLVRLLMQRLACRTPIGRDLMAYVEDESNRLFGAGG